MNLRNIRLNEKMKYKGLCEMLEIEVKTDTRAKQRQFQDIQRYLNITKDKTWYTITGIKEVVDPKIDGRKNNSRPLEIGEDIDNCLLAYFCDEDISYLRTTNRQLGEIVGLINCNYKVACKEKNRLYNYANDKFKLENTEAMYDVLDRAYDKLRNTFHKSLERLESKGHIAFESIIFINDFGRIANVKECKIIKKTKKEVLASMGGNMQKIIRNDKKMKEYFSRVDYLCANAIKGYKSGFEGFEIVIVAEDMEKMDYKTLKMNINQKYISSVIRNIKKSISKRKSKMLAEEKIHRQTGTENEEVLNKWNYSRMNANYLRGAKKIIDLLIDIDYPDVKKELREYSNARREKKYNGGYSLTYEMYISDMLERQQDEGYHYAQIQQYLE